MGSLCVAAHLSRARLCCSSERLWTHAVNETRASGNQHLNPPGGEEKQKHGKDIKVSFQVLESVQRRSRRSLVRSGWGHLFCSAGGEGGESHPSYTFL